VLSEGARERSREEPALGPGWRARAESIQAQALPRGRVAVSCPAPLGVGGLGRHLLEIGSALQRGGSEPLYVCEAGSAHNDGAERHVVRIGAPARAQLRLARPAHAWRMWAASAGFDRAAARSLPDGEHLISFNGTSLAQFRAAAARRYGSCSLMSANSHMRRVLRQHSLAHSQYPLEAPWATHLLERNLREYAAVERIYVSSRYSWQSFVDEGFSEQALSLFPLTPDPRFEPSARSRTSDTFDVLYVGALTVHKGVPLLIEAVRRLGFDDLRLTLVGGWKTRGMGRFIQGAVAHDGRISVQRGDPLPHLRGAALYVHPAYEDGFAYAPAEALACGVPVIVSEDTGMKELIGSAHEGLVVPTGSLERLSEAIEGAYRGELFGQGSRRGAP
jgi:glycosyltransferase involved in cell wall biosynthesis